jgi:hypothetical protein
MGENDAFVEFIPSLTMKEPKFCLLNNILHCSTIKQKGFEQSTSSS